MFQKTLFIFTLLWPIFYATIVPNSNSSFSHLIAGGYEPKIQTHAKYTVSLADLSKFDPSRSNHFGEGHFCAGSIIGLKTILTAAHCVKEYVPSKIAWLIRAKTPKNFVVIAGTPFRTKKVATTQVLHAKSIKVHPQFRNGVASADDIAILQLKESLLEDRVSIERIEFAEKSFATPGETCLHVGWGTLGHNGPQSDALQYVALDILDQEICENLLSIKLDRTICASEKNMKVGAGCNDDSGGPLFCGGQLYGIYNLNVNCSEHLPTHFTEVSKYLNWIKKNSREKLNYKSAARKNLNANYFKILNLIIFIISLA